MKTQARTAPTGQASNAPGKLTAGKVAGLKPMADRYEVYDPGLSGLLVRVSPAGSKIWMFRYYWQGKRTKLRLGSWPDMGLADAREAAVEASKLLERGINPAAAQRPETARRVPGTQSGTKPCGRHSVDYLCGEYMERFVCQQRADPGYTKRILDTEVLPYWAGRDARTITPREVVELLDRVVERGSKVMANRVAATIGQMFRFGIHRAIVETSPVQLLYKPGGKEKPRDRALNDQELAQLLQHVDDACRFTGSKLPASIRILLLTGQRVGELRRAEWAHLDLQALTWTIPPENSKTGVGHTVPLSTWAAAEFRELKALGGRSRWVLPAKSGDEALDEKRLTRSLARCRERFREVGVDDFQLRDLRRTCRTGLAALKVKPHIAERVLNHAQSTIAGTYDKFDYLDEKRDALDRWAAHLETLTGRSGGAK